MVLTPQTVAIVESHPRGVVDGSRSFRFPASCAL
jgi:hypothetical protein